MEKRGKKKGSPKTGGRKPGTPNKATASFRETLDSLGFDVAREAVELYRRWELPPNQQLQLLEMIAAYSHFKPKPLEPEIEHFKSFPTMSDQDALNAVMEIEDE